MNDGVFLTRFFVFVLLVWPLLAVSVVYAARRSSHSNGGGYWLKSLGYSYAFSLLGPVVMLALFLLFGAVGELATVYTIFLGIPLFAVVPVVVAVGVSGNS
jgi:hypothetical protein